MDSGAYNSTTMPMTPCQMYESEDLAATTRSHSHYNQSEAFRGFSSGNSEAMGKPTAILLDRIFSNPQKRNTQRAHQVIKSRFSTLVKFVTRYLRIIFKTCVWWVIAIKRTTSIWSVRRVLSEGCPARLELRPTTQWVSYVYQRDQHIPLTWGKQNLGGIACIKCYRSSDRHIRRTTYR